MPWTRWNSPPRRFFFFFFYRLENEGKGKKKKLIFRDFHSCVTQAGEILSVAAGVERGAEILSILPAGSQEYCSSSAGHAPRGRRRALHDDDSLKRRVHQKFADLRRLRCDSRRPFCCKSCCKILIPGRSKAFTEFQTAKIFFFFLYK